MLELIVGGTFLSVESHFPPFPSTTTVRGEIPRISALSQNALPKLQLILQRVLVTCSRSVLLVGWGIWVVPNMSSISHGLTI